MLHNTIISLALLKVNWDHLKKDYLENFLPFLATLCVKKKYSVIDINSICADFEAEYGLVIPYHPMITIFDRARKRGILKKQNHKLYPVHDKLLELDFSDFSKTQADNNNKLLNSIISFAYDNYSITLTEDDAEKSLLSMLQDRDLEIIFAAEEGRLFPEVESKKTHKFLINKFIQHASKSDSEIFSFILNMAIGHVLASSILYSDFTKFEGSLKNIEFFFDTRFILRVLGTEGEERQHHYIEFLRHVLDEGASLRIFRHTFDEIMAILNTCLKWVDNQYYDPTKASAACNYFVQQNYKQSDVERFIVKAESILKGYRIDIVEAPDPDRYKAFQIDENQLKESIITIYKERYSYFYEKEWDDILLRDIKSISSIYRLRKGKRPHSLSKVGSMFVTTNSVLAYSSKVFQRTIENGGFIYPACITDVFLGTLVWLQSPTRVASLNRKKIIADCYSAVQPSKHLIKKYLQEIEKLKKEDKITEDECYLLRTHRIALNLLEETTMGDPDNFTDKTPEEILELIKKESQAGPIKNYLEIKEKLERTEQDFTQSKDEYESLKNNILKKAQLVANIVSWSLVSILSALFIIGILYQYFGSSNFWSPIKVAIFFVTIIIGILNVLTGFNIRGFRKLIEDWVSAKILSHFYY